MKLAQLASKVKSTQKYFLKELKNECQIATDLIGAQISRETNQALFTKLAAERLDPFELVKQDLLDFNREIMDHLYTGEPELDNITQYYFKFPGKHFRPTIMLLLSRALAGYSENDFKLHQPHRGQQTFSQVIEMIHCSSLIHDDVIDRGEIRRGQEAIHKKVGNKTAVMGGNYLISTASYVCTLLEDMRLMDLVSQIMENLTKGELIQAEGQCESLEEHLVSYCHKTYFKTASLIAHGCKGIGLYSGYPNECFEFGKHLGLGFQYIDDILDFTGDKKTLGKPNLNDMKEGLATGPILFAVPHNDTLLEAVNRKFKGSEDTKLGQRLADQYGIEITRNLALYHLDMALKNLHFIPNDSFAYKALASMAAKIYDRVS